MRNRKMPGHDEQLELADATEQLEATEHDEQIELADATEQLEATEHDEQLEPAAATELLEQSTAKRDAPAPPAAPTGPAPAVPPEPAKRGPGRPRKAPAEQAAPAKRDVGAAVAPAGAARQAQLKTLTDIAQLKASAIGSMACLVLGWAPLSEAEAAEVDAEFGRLEIPPELRKALLIGGIVLPRALTDNRVRRYIGLDAIAGGEAPEQARAELAAAKAAAAPPAAPAPAPAPPTAPAPPAAPPAAPKQAGRWVDGPNGKIFVPDGWGR